MRVIQLVFFLTALLVNLSSAAYSRDHLRSLQENSQDGVIVVKDSTFDEFYAGQKDYFLITLFTASDPKYKCNACNFIKPVFEVLSRSFMIDFPNNKEVFFAIADFSDNENHYNNLQMTTVPHVWIHPPSKVLVDLNNLEDEIELKEAQKKLDALNVRSEHYTYTVPDNFVNNKDYQGAELHLGNFLSQVLHLNILIHRPFDISDFFKKFIFFLCLFLLLKKRGSNILKNIENKYVWFAFSLFIILLAVTGSNFCIQRQVPFVAKNKENEIMYFSGGTHYQFGLEIINISIVYTLLAGQVILLTTIIPKIENIKMKNALTFLTTIALFISYNILTTIFKIKDPEYKFNYWKVF